MNISYRYVIIAIVILVVIVFIVAPDNDMPPQKADSLALSNEISDVDSVTDQAENTSSQITPSSAMTSSEGLSNAGNSLPTAIKLSPEECMTAFTEMQNNLVNDPAYKDYGFWLSDPNTLKNVDYYNYTVKQLEQIAYNGDRTAQHILAEKIRKRNPTRAIYWYKQAAIRGYIYSITSLALFVRDITPLTGDPKTTNGKRTIDESNSLTESQIQQQQVESLAWLLVSQRAMGRSLEDASKTYAGHLQNEQLRKQAQNKSEIYLNHLTHRRQKLGLGPFNNKPYPTLKIDEQVFKACTQSATNN